MLQCNLVKAYSLKIDINPNSNCCGASVASELQHKQDLRKREYV